MDINKLIDHTNLKADATEGDIKKLCRDAKTYGFRSVCVHSNMVKVAKRELRGSGIKVVAVIDWPYGGAPTEVRVFQAKVAKRDGADEIDPVMDVGNFKMGNYDEVLADFKALAKVLPTKVIIETGFLNDQEVVKAAELVKESGSICVKTSTGVEPKTDIITKIHHIKLIRSVVGPDFLIKASGGIGSPEDAQKVVEAGANIIGTSSSLKIIGVSQKAESY